MTVCQIANLCITICCLTAFFSMIAAAAPNAAVLLDAACEPEASAIAESLRSDLDKAGYDVSFIDMDALCRADTLRADRMDLLVLPDASALPLASANVIPEYLYGGGDLLALNTPMWRRVLVKDGSAWVDRETFREKHLGELAGTALFDFGTFGLEGWERATNDFSMATLHEVVWDPVAGPALHVHISKLTNWDTFGSPALGGPFAEDQSLTVFMAKGGPRTTELAVEWTEKDGSRWIATVPLTDAWQLYVLAPEDFRFWESVPARRQDRLRPENAVRFTVGLALSHTALPGDSHEYWIAGIGASARTPLHDVLLDHSRPPALDTLSPEYKLYPATAPVRLSLRTDLPLGTPLAPPRAAAEVWCAHPRPQAGGFDKGRAWRWIPVVEAWDAHADPAARDPLAWRGAAATLLVHAEGPYAGGVWASFGIRDPEWYLTEEARGILRHVAARIRAGVFLIDAGTDFYTYFAGQDMRVGARAVNVSRQARVVTARAALSGKGTPAIQKEWTLTLAPGALETVSETVTVKGRPATGFQVCVELLEGGPVLDRAAHEAHIWRPNRRPRFVTVENGEFVLDGRRWRAHGVNYMPSSGIGTEDWSYFEHWIGARAYDPEIIDRDLRRIRDLGMNAVSIFIYHESLHAQNLLDLLRRLDALGLKANLSLRPGTPMDFEWDKMRDLITFYRIWEHDAVFALDLAWEPMFGDHDARKPWDAAWGAWIIERYGSIENAEQDWEFAAPRHADGQVTNPLGHQTAGDGPWRRMVAAYRRFLDTLLYEKYSRARHLVRGLDTRHLVSFRMAEAGNPTFRWDKAIPYDFAYLAGAVDLLAPEGYGRIGDWERVKPALFEAEHARWADPSKPVMWAEAGVSAWVESRRDVTAERLEFQSDFYAHLYRMVILSGADGIFFWWYPGGYRVNERSDYGIINPDGTDRPVTRTIREHARAFLEGPPANPVDYWIAFDRDAHPDGIAGVYDAAKDEFWQARASGRTPGLRTAGTGTTSATCPLTAVGGTRYSGNNPLQFLDGFFDEVAAASGRNEWLAVDRGATVTAPRSGPVRLRVSLTNLGEAAWLAPGECSGAGGVFLVVLDESGETLSRHPLPRTVSRFESVKMECRLPVGRTARGPVRTILTLEAEGRARFGPRFPITWVPAGI